MSRVEQRTTYRCDGCGVDSASPVNWRTLSSLNIAGQVAYSGGYAHEDYCSSCVEVMHKALKQSKDR